MAQKVGRDGSPLVGAPVVAEAAGETTLDDIVHNCAYAALTSPVLVRGGQGLSVCRPRRPCRPALPFRLFLVRHLDSFAKHTHTVSHDPLLLI